MNLLTTLSGSLMEGFFPAGWDLAKIDACVDHDPATITERQKWWHPKFHPFPCKTLADFDTYMGHEIAQLIRRTRDAGQKLAMILPVGPMGMYRWAVYFLTEWGVSCDHVYGFNMDEWSDAQGNTLPSDNPGAFQYAMEHAFYGPLGKLTVPKKQSCRPMPIGSASCAMGERCSLWLSELAASATSPSGSRTSPLSSRPKPSGSRRPTAWERSCTR
jgi:glucosamine-6-phosphate deaminase